MSERVVECPMCSRSISPDDSVIFERSGLSHVSCRMPRTLTGEERSLLFYYCMNHAVARCADCAERFHLSGLTADRLSGRTHLCPRCRRDLTESIRQHLYGCATLPVDVRHRAQELREVARDLVKKSAQLRDKADVLIHEAEAVIEESRRRLRRALNATRVEKRPTSP